MTRNHTVLVVDDEPSVRALYVDALAEAGHRVEAVPLATLPDRLLVPLRGDVGVHVDHVHSGSDITLCILPN